MTGKCRQSSNSYIVYFQLRCLSSDAVYMQRSPFDILFLAGRLFSEFGGKKEEDGLPHMIEK